MANKKISELPIAQSLTSTDVLPSVNGSTTKQISVLNLANSLTPVSQSLTASYVNGSVHNSSNPALSASYALTASYANNTNTTSDFPFTGSAIISGGLSVTGIVYLSGSQTSVSATGSIKVQTFGTGTTAAGLVINESMYVGGQLDGSPVDKLIYLGSANLAIRGGGTQSTRNSIRFTNGLGLILDGGSSETAGVDIRGGGGPVKITQGSGLQITGSVISTGGFTGSLLGTAATASYINDLNQNLTITGSVIISGSPNPEIRVIGDMIVTGSLIVSGNNGAGIFSQGATLVDYVSTITSTGSYMVWRAPFSCSVVALYGYYLGGTSPQVNALRSGSSGIGRITGSNLTLSSENVWNSAIVTGLQNKDFNTGDSLMIILSGSSNYQLAAQVDFIKKF